MPPLIWTPRALTDLQRLHAFLAEKNRDAARRAVHAIRQGVGILAARPQIGRPADGMEPEFRDGWIPFGDGGYVVRYRADDGEAVILAIRNGKEAGF